MTATRRAESIERTPVSVAAFDEETLEVVGAKQIDDLVSLTPGLELGRTLTGSNNISIRGIASGAGAGTTGVYIDDTPIQVRNLGYGAGTAFPEIFDLERVEVLRGPQGTLFGAGSEGGTVRFIQTAPDLDYYSAYARAEVSTTHNGDESYEAGAAVGGPIVAGVLGFRGHLYYRKDGGYVDAVLADVSPAIDPGTGTAPEPVYPYGNLVDFTTTEVLRKDTNSSDALTARLALEFRPSDAISLTPSISYQRLRRDDGLGAFWIAGSDLADADYVRRVNFQGDPASNPLFYQADIPDLESSRDTFWLYSLDTEIDISDNVQLISNTSYFDRQSTTNLDFTVIDAFQFAFEFFVPEGYKSISAYGVSQENFVQEVRLQSSDTSSPFSWVIGGFYSHNKQGSTQDIRNNFVANLPVLPLFGGVAGGPPFGPGSSALENAFGAPLFAPNNSSYVENRDLTEKQLAGYGQVEYEIVPDLTLIAGLRVAKNDLELDATFRGPLNNDNAPYGAPCPPGETCEVGSGTFAPVYVDTTGFENSETSVTPKFGVSWQATPDHLLYATVAKGFRPAGVNARVPAQFCGPDLANIGYVDGNGDPTQPEIFGSDSVWSYEVGSKNRLANGRVNVDFSAYHIDWSNIQNSVFLPTCLYAFVDNLGDATSEGFDLALDFEPIDDLRVGGTVGYNSTTYQDDVVTPDGTILGAAGSPIGATRPWRFSLYGQYDLDRFYARADLSHLTSAREYGETDPASPQFDPRLRPQDAYTTINLRVGAEFGDVDASIFVDNLTNATPLFGLDAQFNNVVYTASSLRPRTVGLTVAYRY
ncbi:TonB-dependent receptor [Erythrobacter westpacificensis]|uniref:TonB-dependent receptor n=1 Tax=Erythrobacter westpacificensis TaxID=1055231 RepID=A0ABP9K1W4_9SPHN